MTDRQPLHRAGRTRTQSNAWVSSPRPNPQANLRLFCFPYSGAGASIFYPWQNVLPPAIEVCPVQLPGRETRLAEPPFTRLPPLVGELAPALLPLLDKPFAFFGHSMGTLVSFELARCLRQHYGLSPVHLMVSGHNAPQTPDDEPPIHDLPEHEFTQKVRELNGIPEDVLANAELWQLLLPILRADFTVCETYAYQPGRPLQCSITVLGGLQDESLTRQGLQAWREHTTAAFSVRMFPGDHFYLNTARSLLIETIARELYQWVNPTFSESKW
jgi:medium-chain acyl-[acyl-carrier-protein] hydrolase